MIKKRLFKIAVCTAFIIVMMTLLCVTAQGLEDTPIRYGRTTLTGDALHVYDKLAEGVAADTPVTKISFDREVSVSDMVKGFYIFVSDYPDCFWLDTGSNIIYTGDASVAIGINPNYLFTGADLTQAKKDMSDAIDEIMSDLPANGSNYDKALYLHDTLIDWVTYDLDSEYNQSAYSALVNKTSVCAGYARAYQLLLRKVGIRAWTVTGVSNLPDKDPVNHAWNVVWMDDDTCVYTDITWDDKVNDIYRYYFNLSKDEMAADHQINSYTEEIGEETNIVTPNDPTFVLPDCSHGDQSYFDKNDYAFNSSMSVSDVAALFAPSRDGLTRTAVIYDSDGTLISWLGSNASGLYEKLDGMRPADVTCSWTRVGNEFHITFNGLFPKQMYSISFSIANATGSNLTQYVEVDDSITDIILRADNGYYFPTDYSVQTGNGLTVTRNSYTQITISGVPTDDINMMLPSPTAKTKEATPEVTFTATGYDTGELTGVTDGMKYRVGIIGIWRDITSSSLTGLSPCTIQIKKSGNGVTTLDSDVQSITITRPSASLLTLTQPGTVGEKGRIETTSAHQYSTNGTDWIDCSGAMTGLEAGTYYIRVKPSGMALASSSTSYEVVEYIGVEGVAIDETLSVNIGEKSTPGYSINPSNAANKRVTFTSDNPTVATVDPTTGEVMGVSRGTATITVTTEEGGYTDTCTVTVICTHQDVDGWSKDSDEHWHECECGEQIDRAEHGFNNVRFNDEKHWNECICGEKNGESSHTLGEWTVTEQATSQKDGKEKRACECGYFEERALLYVPNTKTDDTDGEDESQIEGGESGGSTTQKVTEKSTQASTDTQSNTDTESEEDLSVGCFAMADGTGLTLFMTLCVALAISALAPKSKKDN